MKQVMVIAVLVLAVAGYANAQSTMTGPLANCNITTTERVPILVNGQDTGYRKFLVQTHNVGGGGAHVDLSFNNAAQDQLLSLDIYGNVNNNGAPALIHLITCQNFGAASTKNKPPTLTNSVSMVATCEFNPNGIGAGSNGIAYLAMKGTTYKKKFADAAPYKGVFSGTVGGGYNVANDFTFIGSLGSVTLKPQ
jgi:hypothetical protein